MQILPTDILGFSDSVHAAGAVVEQAVNTHTGDGPGSFASMLASFSKKEEPKDLAPATILAPAPYNDTKQASALDTLINPKELGELRDRLLKSGVRADQLADFDKLANQPFGASLKQVLASLKLSETQQEFSEEGKSRMKGLLQRLGVGDEAGENIMAMIQSGQSLQAFNQILSSLPPGTVSMDANDLELLGSALKLDDASMKAMLKNMNGRGEFGTEELKTILTVAQKALEQRSKDQQSLGEALETSLPLTLRTALERIKKEAEQAQLNERTVNQSQILITDTVTRATTAQLGTQPGDQTAVTDASRAVRNAQVNRDAEKPVKGETTEKNVKTGAETRSAHEIEQSAQSTNAHAAQATRNESRNETGNGKDQQRGRDAQNERMSPEELMAFSARNSSEQEKNAVRTEQRTNWNLLTSQVSMTQTSTPETSASSAPQNLPTASRAVLSQVEQGMLTALKDGSSRLELQLNPLELGALTVVLVSRNGEVSAMIRPDKAETGELIHQQLDNLRFAMEQQGIKVDKVEVQSQLSEQRDQQLWQGMDQHNKSMEEEAHKRELEQFKRIGKMHRLTDSPLAQMAQNMQGIQQAADITGVHWIA